MNKKIIYFTLLSGLSCCAALNAQGNDDLLSCETLTKPITTVMGFGDSITAGYPYIPSISWEGNGCRCATNSSCCGGYETTLEGFLQTTLPNAMVVNWGIPGETSSDGLSRLSSALRSSLPSHVLLMEGTNDLWWVDSTTVAYNLLSMAQVVRSAGAVPVLATLTPDTRTGSNVKPIAQTNYLIHYLAHINDIVVSDQNQILSAYWSSLSNDGLHPNTSGYYYMATTWYNVLVYGQNL
ncbi:MAG: hypothetical protein BWK76_09825 [Desulfobulbaceae bacterium A2]|nr:MAG: hypothetical protein BWK76_09825 [Desulfobulbaceae bacterium A2]